MKTELKRAAEALLMGAGAARLGAFGRRSRTLILAYHNIVPSGHRPAGERSLHLPQRAFAAQLDALARYCDVIPLDAVFDPPVPGRTDRPRVVITFDDAYRGAVTAGIDELARSEMPATFFVAPGFLDGNPFWWDSYSSPEAGALPLGFRDAALQECRGMDGSVRAWAAASRLTPADMPAHAMAASQDELRLALERAPITLGCHTWSHANLARLEGNDLISELVRPLEWLRDRFDRVSDWLSYPYGLFSAATKDGAARAGYAGALRIDGGWLSPESEDRFAIPRLNVPSGISTRGLALRVTGVLAR